jgi:hypothetical protein
MSAASHAEPVEAAPSGPEQASPTVPDEVERGDQPQGMIPGRGRRRTKVERVSMRVLATGGIIGMDVALGAILVANNVSGWIVGLAVGLTSVILAAVLWSSRQL